MNAAPPPDPVSGGSLRLRLLAGTLAWMLLSIALAGWGLRALFQDHITQQLQAQLVMQLNHLSSAVDSGPDARVRLAPMAGDARPNQPRRACTGRSTAWAPAQAALARSRSLWDQTLALPLTEDASAGRPGAGAARRPGPRTAGRGARPLQLPDGRCAAAAPGGGGRQGAGGRALQRFTRMLLLALGMLALGLALAVAVQLQLALRPLQQLRARLAAVRGGQTARLEGRFPQELQPLVNEFNHVLAENADMVQRARTQAGNLAHAVHTPLSILANAAAQDGSPLAQLVTEQVASARRQVDYHLARARAAAAVRATGLRTPVLEPVQALLRTMQRLHAERPLVFELAPQAQDGAFRGEEQDLYELLGNLIDNAGKWARARVVVDVQREGGQLCFTVDDDGPGITPGAAWPHVRARRAARRAAPRRWPGAATSCARWPKPTVAACRRWPRPWAVRGCACVCQRQTETLRGTGPGGRDRGPFRLSPSSHPLRHVHRHRPSHGRHCRHPRPRGPAHLHARFSRGASAGPGDRCQRGHRWRVSHA